MTADSDDPRSDADLVRASADGDQAAFEALYRRYAPLLMVRLQHRWSDWEVVEEAMQDTFVAVWQSAGRWEERGGVPAWIRGIARRRLVDVVRRRGKTWSVTQLFDSASDLAKDRCGQDRESSAEEEALQNPEFCNLYEALSHLSPKLRDVVQLCLLDEFTTREAALLLAIPHGTVKTRLKRAREQLREWLDHQKRNCDELAR